MTFAEAMQRLDAAGLWGDLFDFIELEPLPAGQYILEGLVIDDPAPGHIAGDGSGGAYVRLASGAILLISSEGEADVIGRDEKAVLGMALGMSGLVDALRFCGPRDLTIARASWHAGLARWRRPAGPINPDAAGEIAERLGLAVPPDPFAVLHAAVHGSARLVRGEDGSVWRGFGSAG